MRFNGLDLNLLVVLDALLIEQSITATAERLHRTQPAISAALRRLREYFGDDLFVMNGRNFMPTPFALSIAQPVRTALDHIQTFVIAENAFEPATASRRFRLIMSDYMATVFFRRITRRVAEEAPGIGFDIIQFDDDFDAPLNRGEVDFLLFPEIFMSDRHPHHSLFTEELVAVTCAQTPREPLTMKSFFASRHVAVKFGRSRKPSIEEFLMTEFGLRREIDIELPNFTLVPQFIVGTQRIATMHRRLAEQFADILPLRIEALPFSLPAVNEALQWPLLNQKDPACTWLRELIINEAQRFAIEPGSARFRL
jgi:LysR family nod box-dependent transcriptional activator